MMIVPQNLLIEKTDIGLFLVFFGKKKIGAKIIFAWPYSLQIEILDFDLCNRLSTLLSYIW